VNLKDLLSSLEKDFGVTLPISKVSDQTGLSVHTIKNWCYGDGRMPSAVALVYLIDGLVELVSPPGAKQGHKEILFSKLVHLYMAGEAKKSPAGKRGRQNESKPKELPE